MYISESGNLDAEEKREEDNGAGGGKNSEGKNGEIQGA